MICILSNIEELFSTGISERNASLKEQKSDAIPHWHKILTRGLLNSQTSKTFLNQKYFYRTSLSSDCLLHLTTGVAQPFLRMLLSKKIMQSRKTLLECFRLATLYTIIISFTLILFTFTLFVNRSIIKTLSRYNAHSY